jgi:O-glycosyl hydrolase
MMVARLAVLSAALVACVQAAPQVVDAAATGPVIKVNAAQKYQYWDGTGVSEAFQRSLVLHELNTKSQNLALDLMFSNTTGAGFTILRNGLGSDTTDPFDLMKSIAPVPPASNSSALNYIPLPRNDQWQVWLSKEAIARGVYTIYADAWSGELNNLIAA